MNFSLSFALTCTIQCNLECDPSILSATKSAYRHFSHWTTGKNVGWKRSLENFCLQILPEAGLASLWGKSLGYIALMGQSLRCFRWTPRKRPPVVKRNPGGEKNIVFSSKVSQETGWWGRRLGLGLGLCSYVMRNTFKVVGGSTKT